MTMHEALHTSDDVDRLYESRKEEEEVLLVLNIELMNRYDDLKTSLKSVEELLQRPEIIKTR